MGLFYRRRARVYYWYKGTKLKELPPATWNARAAFSVTRCSGLTLRRRYFAAMLLPARETALSPARRRDHNVGWYWRPTNRNFRGNRRAVKAWIWSISQSR